MSNYYYNIENVSAIGTRFSTKPSQDKEFL